MNSELARLAGADNEVDYYLLRGYWPGCTGYLGQRKRGLYEGLGLEDSARTRRSQSRALARGW